MRRDSVMRGTVGPEPSALGSAVNTGVHAAMPAGVEMPVGGESGSIRNRPRYMVAARTNQGDPLVSGTLRC